MFNNILVPLDGSKLAEQALLHATALAKQFQSHLTLVRVSNSAELQVAEAFAGLADSASLILQLRARHDYEAEAYLEKLCNKLKADGVVADAIVPVTIDVASAILQTAESCNADIIVMSTHGRSGVTRWVLGSVAERVLRSASMPILLYRSEE